MIELTTSTTDSGLQLFKGTRCGNVTVTVRNCIVTIIRRHQNMYLRITHKKIVLFQNTPAQLKEVRQENREGS